MDIEAKDRCVEPTVVITQSRMGFKTRFEFGPEKLTETVADSTGEGTFSFPYLNICTEDVDRISLKSRRPTGYLWSGAAVLVFMGMRAGYDIPVFGAVVGALGFALFFLGILADHFRWFPIVVERMPVIGNSQNIRIVCNKDRDRIHGLILERRRMALRALFERVDEIKDPEGRKSQLDYLLKCGAISEEEHARAVTNCPTEPQLRFAVN